MKNKIRRDFPWFENNPNLIYLDSAATSLKPNVLMDGIYDYLYKSSYNPHNNDSKYTYDVHIKIEETRQLLADHLNCNKNNIIFTPGATHSLNYIVEFLKPFIFQDDEIVLTTLEHTSNILPWFKLVDEKKAKISYIKNKNMFLNQEEILNSITNKTKVVSFCNGSNLIGSIIDAEKLSIKIKKINPNIIICIDATQYLPMHKMYLNESNIDFVVCSAHKMCGPTGIGLMYISDLFINKITPVIWGGGMNNNVYKNKFDYLKSIDKFEGGTPNSLAIYGWNSAMKYLNTIDLEKTYEYLCDLKLILENKLSQIENVEIINKKIKSHILIFRYKDVFSQDFAHYLGINNIIVRSGLSCAKLIHDNINVSDVIRVSLYIYNDIDDIEKLVSVIKKYRKGDEINGLI